MDRYYDLFSAYASSVREMNIRRNRVVAAENDASSVAYHAAELVQHASKVEANQSMLLTVLQTTIEGEMPELYREAWELAEEGKSDEMTRLFITDAKQAA